eukprot:UN00580
MFTQINLRIHCNERIYMGMMTAAMYTGSYTLLSFLYCLLRWYRYPKHQQRYDRFYNQGQISLVSKCHRITSSIYHISLTVVHTAFFLAIFGNGNLNTSYRSCRSIIWWDTNKLGCYHYSFHCNCFILACSYFY